MNVAFILVLLSFLVNSFEFQDQTNAMSLGNSEMIIAYTWVGDLKIKEALAFCRKQKLDTTVAFFSDMSLHSGKKRFYIIDLQKKVVLHESLVCHGMGKESTPEQIVFSNEPGSNCTSLGKYKTGKRAFSNWGIGIHYKMIGLEKTYSNAFKRIVVLHSYDPIPEEEIFPKHLPMGWSQGCPVISNATMREADKILQKKSRPLLIWIYK